MALNSDNTVLFDMDGLLIDSERLSLQTFLDTTTVYGLGDQSPLFMSLIGTNEVTLTAILEEGIGRMVDIKKFRRDWSERYHARVIEEQVPLKSGVLALLNWLEEQNIKMAVATSSNSKVANIKLTNCRILPFFDTVVSGDQVSRGKPDPEIFLKAADAIGADHSQTTVLEDSFNGVRAGVSAGMNVIQVPDLVEPDAELLQLGHRVCRSMEEVLNLFQHKDYRVL